MKTLKQTGNTKLSELSIEELTTEKKKRTVILIFFSILLGIMVGTCIYATIKKGVSALTFMPIAFLPIFLIIWKSQKDVCNEIKSR
ncbi:hypothetical protein [Chryseobacterium jejuense]|uniref:Redox-active disulfide protein 2 n=1 Tax=Chryseobacterium jejuense TaxID=445960 RepID=A0A2X2XKB6_CHRJE|nr:hypothetical protein [Chryseobacterium jejuense]SDI35100.1 hypothetical protein SAMN05421542_0930 [Chryseobacterium jejuense]SQB26790.1 Uncharacterised protein [Chryseobacterium jejuense]